MARHTRSTMIGILQGIPLFSKCTARERREVAQLCFGETFEAGHSIVAENDDTQFLAVIVEGRARVVSGGKTIAAVGPGDAVGEMSLIDGQRRSATVVADTQVEAVILYRTAFLKLLDSVPSLARSLLLAQTARLREADRKLTALG